MILFGFRIVCDIEQSRIAVLLKDALAFYKLPHMDCCHHRNSLHYNLENDFRRCNTLPKNPRLIG
jgi:hypothetical protein